MSTLFGRPVHHLLNANIYSNIVAATKCIKSMPTWSRGSAVFQTQCQNGEEMWSKWGLSIWEMADLLELLQTTVSKVCWEWCEKRKKTSSEQQFCGQKRVVNTICQRIWVKADRKVTVKQISTHYNSGMQESISEHMTHQTSQWIGYSSIKRKCNKYLIKCSVSVYWVSQFRLRTLLKVLK